MSDEANQAQAPDANEALAKSIIAEAASKGVKADVKINPHPIPPNIASNLIVFLQRVKCEGMEAIAWVEAYHYVQQWVPQQSPGVPFTGLPQK